MEYRKDIQVLRGISVLFVVLFHFEVSGFSGGFLGVDVFFVISGFLMACLYDTGQACDFFKRRALRILPDYFLTILITLVAVSIIAAPPDLASVCQQAIYSLFFLPNIGHWLDNSYFSKDTFKPLLHLWSLGVEIQFYLLVPAIHFLSSKSRIFIPAAILASLALCFMAITISPKTAFFLLPFRMWEFLIGFLVARKLTKHGRPARKHQAVSFAALAVLLVVPLLGVDGETATPVTGHPGLSALAVCIATATLLASGLPELLVRTRPAGVLETFGKYSYSIYLVHFPVITLILYRPFAGTVLGTGNWSDLTIIIATIALISILLFRYVEMPLRRSAGSWITAVFGMQIALVVLAFSATSVVAIFYSDRANSVFAAASDRDTYRCGKISRILNPYALTCALHEAGQPKSRVLLIGNSHADSIKFEFTQAAREHGASVRFVVPNNPLMVDEYNADIIINAVTRHHIDHIVLHFSPGALPPEALRRLIDLAGQRNILVDLIAPVPVWPRHIPEALYDNLRGNAPLPRQTLENYTAASQNWRRTLAGAPNGNFRVFEAAPYLCRPQCRLTDEAGRPLYFDSQHLTLTGSAYLQDLFREILAPSRKSTGRIIQ